MNTPQDFTKKCSAVVVSYNPDLSELFKMIRQLSANEVYTILVDNSSENINQIKEESKSYPLCHLISLNKNTGIATAQNIGIKAAHEANYQFIAFFDQDSSIENNFFHTQLQTFEEIKKTGANIAAICPALIDRDKDFHYKIVNINKYGLRSKIDTKFRNNPFPSTLTISSGSLVSIDALYQIGLMNESFFIDYVDTEWCLRAHAKGYEIYVNPQVKMLHAIGDNSLSLLKWRVPVHSAFRRYYRIRNAFFLLKMSHVPPLLALREITFNLVHQVVLILFGQNKMGYVRSLWRGLKDGLNGKY